MNIFFLLLLINLMLVIDCSTDNLSKRWEEFKHHHGKRYGHHDEESHRKSIFQENLNKINQHNYKEALNVVKFKMGINKFADMTNQEFVKIYNGIKVSNIKPSDADTKQSPPLLRATLTPSSIDWRSLGAVTPVKHQLACGSCWAFGSTGAIEGQIFRKTGKLISLSEQNLIDCTISYGNFGCDGGLMNNAFRYVRYNKGVSKESPYPYEATVSNCRYNSVNSGGTIIGHVNVEPYNELKLQQKVASIGPIAAAMDSSLETFQFYASGIYNDAACSSDNVNHGVLIVGYGSDGPGGEYWIVKNSWGKTWGEEGYVRIARNKNNMCGIATMPSYPTV